MANSMPWSVRGIDPDIREQAVEAAHRSGLSVGQWLNQVLSGSLDEDEMEEEMQPRARRGLRRRPDRVAELGERLGRLGQRRTATAAHRFSAEDDDSPVLDLLQEAVEAIERIEKRQVTHAPAREDTKAKALAEQLRAFETRIEQALTHKTKPAPTGEATPDRALEQRLAGIMATLERMQQQIALPMIQPQNPRDARLADEDPAFSRTLAEIEARRRALDADLTPRGRAQAVAQSAAEPARPAPSDGALNAMRGELAKLTQRIDDLRHAPQGASDEVAAVRRELAQVSATLEQISPQRLVGLVEHAVSGLADRLVREPHAGLPASLAEPLERVHEDVRAVLREVASSRGTDLLSREVGNIARRLDQISAASSPDQIERIATETGAIKQLVTQALRSQPLEGLAHQIEQLSRQVERFQSNPAARDDRAMLDAIRDVSDRLERLDPRASFAGLESRLGAIASLENRLSAVAGIEAKLGEIALGMEKLAKKTQPLPKLDSISERLERIDRALDNPKASPLAGLDQLTARLDHIGSQLDKVSTPPKGNDDALLSLMERLSNRMEQVAGATPDSRALDQLHAEIAGLARRVEATGGTPAGLDSLERAVSDLFSQFDQTRRDMRELAESAAVRAAEQALQTSTPQRSSDGEALAAEGLLLLKRDLSDFKSAHSEAESRTRETLQQVQTTLSLMMKRLGEAEERARSAPPPMAPVAPAKPDVTARIEAAARGEAPARSDFAAERPASPKRPAPAPQDDLDLPLEPGLEPGVPGRMGHAAPAFTGPDAAPSLDPRTNFIAAARRAAQAAADKSQAALNETAERGPAGGATQNARGGKGGPTLALIARARKPILLGLAALVFSMGALKVISSRQPGMIPATPAQPGAGQSQTPGTPAPSRAAEPETTGAVAPPHVTSEVQPLPNTAAPGLNAPSIGDANFNTRLNKRGQRLSDTSAHSQTDPMTVGSLGQDGAARPIDTSRSALAELANKTNLKGMESLRDAAVSGDVASIFEIGSRLADGRGVARDPQAAARWFEQSAATGHAPSQYRLGSLYREGRGISKDANLAFQWFDRAAAQGHVLAMHNAAVLLAEGVHGTPDYSGAALWFKRAAEYGIKDSQFNIGILYARGLGVQQDLGESYRWFSIAANQGDVDAGKKRDDMAARLSKEQLSAEMEKVKAFKPKKPDASANEVIVREAVAKRG
ncbi:MAG: hypothetical protein LCH39_10500 [Proteobacteria bacterium]|nr:hypothetical protein [Pseudomonadota bacterium]